MGYLSSWWLQQQGCARRKAKRQPATPPSLESLEDRVVLDAGTHSAIPLRFAQNPVVGFTSAYAQNVATGDFNGDGKIDIVTANLGSNTVSVLLGNGDGTTQWQNLYGADPFQDSDDDGSPDRFDNAPSTANPGQADGDSDGVGDIVDPNPNTPGDVLPLPSVRMASTGRRPYGIVVDDFDADGQLDVAVNNSSDNSVSVFRGNGDGSFQSAATYGSCGQYPQFISAADIDSDGKRDLVVANAGSGVSVLRNQGDGSFTLAYTSHPNVWYYSRAVAIADFNADGDVDLAITSDAGSVSLFLGHGNCTFSVGASYQGLGLPVSVKEGDFNADSKIDLAVADGSGQGGVWTIQGNGDGTFQAPVRRTTGACSTLVVSDLNGDGHQDLAYGSTTGTVQCLVGHGDGTFESVSFNSMPMYTVGFDTESLIAADLNGDRAPELIAGNYLGEVTVFLNSPVATHLAVSGPASVAPGEAFAVTVTATTGFGSADTAYTGTIHFSSSDVAAGLRTDYTFLPSDHGSHTFEGLTLAATGAQTVAATDLTNAAVTGTTSVTVNGTTVYWTGAAGNGDWNTPGNWSGNAVPGADDDVVIDLPGHNDFLVRHNADVADAVHSLHSQVPIYLTGGSLEIGAAAQFASNLNVDHATLKIADSLTVAGELNLNRATVAALDDAATIYSQGPAIVSGTTLDAVTLVNDGNAELRGTLTLNGGARLDNRGTFDFRNDHAEILGDAAAALDNFGVLRKSHGDARHYNYSAIHVATTNHGYIDLQEGRLILGLGGAAVVGTNGSSIVGAEGTRLDVRGPGFFDATSTVYGHAVEIFAPTTFAGTYRSAATVASAGTVFTGTVLRLGTFLVNDAVYLHEATLDPLARDLTRLSVGAGASLTAVGDFNVSGEATLAGTLLSAGDLATLTVQNGGSLRGTLDGYLLSNQGGEALVVTGDLSLYHGARIDNAGVLDVRDATLGGDAGAILSNYGTLRKSQGTLPGNNTTIAIPFDNFGAVEVTQGRLRLGGSAAPVTGYAGSSISGLPGTQIDVLGQAAFDAASTIDAHAFEVLAPTTVAGSFRAAATTLHAPTLFTGSVQGLGELRVTDAVEFNGAAPPTSRPTPSTSRGHCAGRPIDSSTFPAPTFRPLRDCWR